MNLNERLDRMFDEYQRRRDNLADIQRRMTAVADQAAAIAADPIDVTTGRMILTETDAVLPV